MQRLCLSRIHKTGLFLLKQMGCDRRRPEMGTLFAFPYRQRGLLKAVSLQFNAHIKQTFIITAPCFQMVPKRVFSPNYTAANQIHFNYWERLNVRIQRNSLSHLKIHTNTHTHCHVRTTVTTFYMCKSTYSAEIFY